MADFESLSLEELEGLCDEDMRDFLRELHFDDDQQYRDSLIRYLAEPKLPTDDLFEAIRTHADPQEAWAGVLAVCRRSAAGAPWDKLPMPDVERDVEAARKWLDKELAGLPLATGVYLGLDTLNMRRQGAQRRDRRLHRVRPAPGFPGLA